MFNLKPAYNIQLHVVTLSVLPFKAEVGIGFLLRQSTNSCTISIGTKVLLIFVLVFCSENIQVISDKTPNLKMHDFIEIDFYF